MSERSQLIVPSGTQVVTLLDFKDKDGGVVIPKGAVGVILSAPTDNFHSYRVRFPDGKKGNFLRRKMAIRKHYQKEGLEIPNGLEDYELQRYVLYRCVVGSWAYGLDHGGSDTDVRGIYLLPADFHWSNSSQNLQCRQSAPKMRIPDFPWHRKKGLCASNDLQGINPLGSARRRCACRRSAFRPFDWLAFRPQCQSQLWCRSVVDQWCERLIPLSA